MLFNGSVAVWSMLFWNWCQLKCLNFRNYYWLWVTKCSLMLHLLLDRCCKFCNYFLLYDAECWNCSKLDVVKGCNCCFLRVTKCSYCCLRVIVWGLRQLGDRCQIGGSKKFHTRPGRQFQLKLKIKEVDPEFVTEFPDFLFEPLFNFKDFLILSNGMSS